MAWWIFFLAVALGAISGSVITAVYLLDHSKEGEKRKWWEDE